MERLNARHKLVALLLVQAALIGQCPLQLFVRQPLFCALALCLELLRGSGVHVMLQTLELLLPLLSF